MSLKIKNTKFSPVIGTFSSLVTTDLYVEDETKIESLEVQDRLTIPIYSGLPAVQDEGAIIYNSLDDNIYKSDSVAWSMIGASTLVGAGGITIVGDTVSVDAPLALVYGGTSTAVPPTTGQILVATSASTTDWTDVSSVLTTGDGITISGNTISVDAPLAIAYGGTATAGPPTTGQILIATNASTAYWTDVGSALIMGDGITISGNTISVDAPLAIVYGGTSTIGPPTTGQILVATSASTADWTDASAALTAGDGITISGNTISVDAPLAIAYGGTATAGPPTTGQILVATSASTTDWTDVSAALTEGAGITITGNTIAIAPPTTARTVLIAKEGAPTTFEWNDQASNVLGTNNTIYGINAGGGLAVGGNNNTFLGYKAGNAVTTGDQNVCIGSGAGDSITIQNNNVLIGYNAGGAGSNTASENVTVGANTGAALTTGRANVLIGYAAGRFITTAIKNVAIGQRTAPSITGNQNVVIGTNAAETATTGNKSVAIGYRASWASIGGNCVAIGYRSGLVNTGNRNVFVGSKSGRANTSGVNNTFLGKNSGKSNLTNSDCTYIGYSAGTTATGYENVCVGSSSDLGAANNKCTCIGKSSTSSVSDGIAVGHSATADTVFQVAFPDNYTHIKMTSMGTTGGGTPLAVEWQSAAGGTYGVGTIARNASSIKYKENVVNLEVDSSKIYKLRPVSFTWKKSGDRSFGMIGEEVASILPEIVAFNSDGSVEGIAYQMLPTLIVNEMIKLQNRVEELENKIQDS